MLRVYPASYTKVHADPHKMPRTFTSTILSADLSKHVDPFHLKTWLSLHFGKGSFYIKRYTGDGSSRDSRAAENMYEIWAPRMIIEVSPSSGDAPLCFLKFGEVNS